MKKRHGGIVVHESRDEFGVLEVVQDDFHRSLHFGTPPKQSSMRLDDPVTLVLGYTRAMLCALLFAPAPRSALIIGLGGGSLAKFLLHHFPVCRVDAVESREAVVRIAYGHFRLPEHEPRLRVIVDDGDKFVRADDAGRFNAYDLILVDAFDHAGMVEAVGRSAFFDACRAKLAPGGVFSANLWVDQKGALEHTLDALDRTFDDRVLRLPVPAKGNLVALAPDVPSPRRRLKQMDEAARHLSNKYDIEFTRFLKALRRANRRLLPF